MTSIYKITNDEGRTVPFNEIALLKIIKVIGNRNKPTKEYCIDLWENLEGRNFDEKYLKLV